MPDFRSVDRGFRAWSDQPGKSTSDRVETGSKVRPEAEIRLKDRRIEIRTGARVTRARGPWTSFKRAFTKLRSATWTLSKQGRKDRELRHAEYRFDRHVNRLVEDLANGKRMDIEDVARRLKALSREGDRIKANDPSVDDTKLAKRLEKNLAESLRAIAHQRPEALYTVLDAFRPGGAMHNLPVNYAIYHDPSTAALLDEDRDSERGLEPIDYVARDIPNAPPTGIQNAIRQLSGVPGNMQALARQTGKEQLQRILEQRVPDKSLHDVVNELDDELGLLRAPDREYVSSHLAAYMDGLKRDGELPDRKGLATELRLALAGVRIGLPERLAESRAMRPSRSNPPFPEDIGLAFSSGQADRATEIEALKTHFAALDGWRHFATGGKIRFDETELHHALGRLANEDPADRAHYEEKLSETLEAVKKQLWRFPDGPQVASLRKLQAELTAALARMRLQGLADPDRLAQARSADALYDSPLYDSKAVRRLTSKNRIGANNQFPNPFKGMPTSEFWKLFVDREYQQKWDGPKPYYEGVFDRGAKAEPGFMRGMVEAMDREVCGKLGQRITADDIERLHDVAVGHEDEERMYRGYRDKLIASYDVQKWSKNGMRNLEKRLASRVDGKVDKRERDIVKLDFDGKLKEIRQMNRDETTDNPPDGMKAWGFINKEAADPKVYFWPKDHAQSKLTTEQTLATYYKEIGRATTERQKLRAIIKCCQTLHQLHVFRDGNARTMGMLLLNRLLMENGMLPTILEDPKAFKGLDEDEMIDEIKQGQTLFKIVASGADMRPPDDMRNFK